MSRVDAIDFGGNCIQKNIEFNRNESDSNNSNERECDNKCHENYSRENHPDTDRSSNSNDYNPNKHFLGTYRVSQIFYRHEMS